MPFFAFRLDHLQSTSGIICGSGSFPVWGSFIRILSSTFFYPPPSPHFTEIRFKVVFVNRINNCCPSDVTKARHLASRLNKPHTVQNQNWLETRDRERSEKRIVSYTTALRWCNLFSPGQKISPQSGCIGTAFLFLSNAIKVKSQF